MYIREGCYTCHSQMIRPFVWETARYGGILEGTRTRYTTIRSSGAPNAPGRISRASEASTRACGPRALAQPSKHVAGQTCRPYAHLRTTRVDLEATPNKLRASRSQAYLTRLSTSLRRPRTHGRPHRRSLKSSTRRQGGGPGRQRARRAHRLICSDLESKPLRPRQRKTQPRRSREAAAVQPRTKEDPHGQDALDFFLGSPRSVPGVGGPCDLLRSFPSDRDANVQWQQRSISWGCRPAVARFDDGGFQSHG